MIKLKNLLIFIVLAGGIIGGLIFLQNNNTNTQSENIQTQEQTNQNADSPKTVEIKGFAFSPKELRIKVGESVTFINRDSIGHTATDINSAGFDTGILNKDESKSITFDTKGTFEYKCTPHPNMRGKIIVE